MKVALHLNHEKCVGNELHAAANKAHSWKGWGRGGGGGVVGRGSGVNRGRRRAGVKKKQGLKIRGKRRAKKKKKKGKEGKRVVWEGLEEGGVEQGVVEGGAEEAQTDRN